MKVESFSDVYERLLFSAMAWRPVLNERTGHKIRAGYGGEAFKLDLASGTIPLPAFRKIHIRSVAAEVAWFLRGKKDVEWIANYAPLWNKFAEADGTVKAAYGWRWRYHFGRDQVAMAISALKANHTDRRIYIAAWDPREDGLGNPGKNVPCPIGFTLSIQDGALHSALTIRSSDLFVGLPYDVAGHAMLMHAFCVSLGVSPGTMTVMLGHPHLYDVHTHLVKEGSIQGAQGGTHQPVMPGIMWSIENIQDGPDMFVDHATECGKHPYIDWPPYNPRPVVVE